MPALIELQDVGLSYPLRDRSVPVLRGLNLLVQPGESVAVVGPSGSGKTSLLLLLSGLARADAGRLLFDGADLGRMQPDELADLRARRIGIVFQSFHLLPALSALDNVALPLQLTGRAGAHERAQALLARVGLVHRGSHRPTELSGGEQQRVAIARALAAQPALLLADEPTGNLDDHTAEAIRTLLLELNRESGTTLVLVTHDMGFANRCDRVLRLGDGRLQEDARPPALQAHRPAEAVPA